MKRTVLVLACGVLMVFAGCGPMQTPMPARLNDEDQKQIDEGWEKALTPVGRLDHQSMLDVLVGTGAYQYGVDRLSLRSEKRVGGATVVMEISFDRAAPAGDRFEVTVLDDRGRTVRRERFNRDEVEATCKELFAHDPPAAQGAAKTSQQARWEKIQEFFPKAREKDGKGGVPGRGAARPPKGP